MSGPALAQEDIFAKARHLRAAGVPLPEIERYLSSRIGGSPSARPEAVAAPHSKFTPAQLVARADRQVENARDEEAAAEPSYTQSALGGIAALGAEIPGVEAAQSAVRSAVRGQSLRDARDDIHAAEDANPASDANKLIGGATALMTVPGSPLMQGARFGVAHGLLKSDPEATVEDRLHSAAKEGAAGAVVGVGSAAVGAGARSLAPRVLAALRAARPSEQGVVDAVVRNRPLRLLSSEPAPSVTPQEAASKQLQDLLQKNVDEGVAARDAVPPTNWDLMGRIEDALIGTGPGNAARRMVPKLRMPAPDVSPTGLFP